ncbi:hypothetical protein SeLEV6574_g03649 [Synchytrium endobioticum]|uniref:F-box domain-containing protein n=1 Tax=Synchytrium endobioticum TaxID=286115 RepID=A0A507D3I9_9FUNG|nr:hypothetical protein SeLEV6574_g03649 [Synchytrium endobioticum]
MLGGKEEQYRSMAYDLYSESRIARYSAFRKTAPPGLKPLTRHCLESMAANINYYYQNISFLSKYRRLPEPMINLLAELVAERMRGLPGEAVFTLFIKDCQPTRLNLSIWGNHTSILQSLKRHKEVCEVVKVFNMNDPPDSGKKEDVVAGVLKFMPNLISFDARGCRKVSSQTVTIQDLKPILILPKLNVLKLSNTPLGSCKSIAAVINEIPSDSAAPLQRLKVSDTDFGSPPFEAIAKKFGKTLVCVDMMNTPCRKLAPLKYFDRLEKLNVSHLTKTKSGPNAELPKDFVSALKESQHQSQVVRLRTFICGGSPDLAQRVLNSVIPSLPGLARLSLYSCPGVTDLDIIFKTCLGLVNLDVSDTGIKDESFQILSKAEVHQHTSIPNQPTIMVMPASRIRFLNISKSRIGDLGISYICRMPELEELLLEATSITEVGVKDVAIRTSVTHLNLTSCRGIAPADRRSLFASIRSGAKEKER